ncbi:MAG: bifunctional nuclease family protein [Planctomycetes bacterium]|jgi:hypothetical protein|nr:bifunctional nuclease family protein [Planctomycetota bacterium]MBT4029517.1 bifunctional nuclease family protein [Planctomycetota bacterium]MBT4560613.1 bifunctional nuclease family protein [Planctomycetota bacterium]MBT5102316.1 bifunctional nuclease family protein [Planctomycetota bacterium]MBT5119551.1 bifunctional nuclease family protein [Planctomycetota bacterium]
MKRTQVRVTRLVLVEKTPQQFLELRESGDSKRVLTMVIARSEAEEIQRCLKQKETPRPLTHELTALLMNAGAIQLADACIHYLSKGTFKAQLTITTSDGKLPQIIDCRPSDAIALCLRMKAPIFVTENVWETATKPKD